MSTNSGFEINEQHNDGEFGDRSAAVRRAAAGVEAWRAALDAQRSAVPHHTDLYGLTRELASLFGPVGELMQVMSQQVGGYADSLPPGESVYDDTRTDDPRALLAEAAAVLTDIARKVSWSAVEMNRFWSLIGRIGVETTRPDATGAAGEATP